MNFNLPWFPLTITSLLPWAELQNEWEVEVKHKRKDKWGMQTQVLWTLVSLVSVWSCLVQSCGLVACRISWDRSLPGSPGERYTSCLSDHLNGQSVQKSVVKLNIVESCYAILGPVHTVIKHVKAMQSGSNLDRANGDCWQASCGGDATGILSDWM